MFSAQHVYVIFGNIFSCDSLMGRYCSHSLTHTLTHNAASAVFVEVDLDDTVFSSRLIKIPTYSECFLHHFCQLHLAVYLNTMWSYIICSC